MLDPTLSVHIYFGVAVFHVAFIVVFWFTYCQNGLLMQY